MTSFASAEKTYDLFVSYADDDREWVEGYLLDALCQAEVVCQHEAAFALGAPRLLEFERAVQQSKRTLLVLSPAYFASNVTNFVDVLAQAYGQESGTWPVIPVILERVELPPRLKFVEALDLSDPESWERAIERLCAEVQRPAPGKVAPPPCPYPGMTPFSEESSDLFFGREEEIEQILQRLRLERFMTVIGPSGSGKSSLVAAGLVPALRESRLFGPGEWVVRRIRPGDRPRAALKVALDSDAEDPVVALTTLLSSSPDGSRLLLIVDQLEELFTVAAEGSEEFQECLNRLAEAPHCYVVATLRADFYPELMTSRLWPLVSAHRFEVLPLEDEQLREAIVRPAEEVGVYIEGPLVERLLADAAGEPGLLPLVQETMVCLWEKLERRLLPLRAYEALVLPHKAYAEMRGLHVALARQADATLSQLSPSRQALARRIFLRLVQFGEGRSDVRRQQRESALRTAGDDAGEFDAVLEHLASRRLVTLTGDDESGGGERRVDLAHETLILGWPTFRTWLDERREGEQTRRRLAAKASEWVRLGHGDGGLLDQVELLEAERWLEAPDTKELGIDGEILELIAVSRRTLEAAEREREAARQRELEQARALAAEQQRRAEVERQRADEQARARRALSRRARALAVLTCVMVAAAAFATVQQRRADRAARVAGSRALAAQARLLADERLDLALLLAREAYKLNPTVEARGSVFAALERHPRLTTFLHGHTDRAGPAVFSPDGSLVASGGDDDRVILWKASTGEQVGQPLVGHTDDVRAVAFTPDGRLLVTGGHDRTVRLWDAARGVGLGPPLAAHTDRVRALAVSPDGATLASGGVDRTILLWDLASREVRARLSQESEVNSLAFSPDGRQLVAGSDDGRVVLWDVAGRHASLVLSGHTDLVRTVAFSPDGRTVASAGNDRRILLWDAAAGTTVGELTGHVERVFSLAFRPDGQVLASGGRDRTVILWDVVRRQPLGQPLTGHSDSVRSVDFARDGSLVTASDDRSVALWRLDVRHRLGQPLSVESAAVTGLSVSEDGRRAATASAATVRLWNLDSGRVEHDLEAGEPVAAVAVSGDGNRVAAGTLSGGVTVWDVASGSRLLAVAGDGNGATLTVALDWQGQILAAGGQGGAIRRWDLASGRPVGETIKGPADWLSVALTSDGRQLAAGALDGRLWFWKDARAADLAPLGRVLSCPAGTQELLCGRPVQAVAFSPDGSRLVSGSSDASVSLWDPSRSRPDGRPLRQMNGHTRPVRTVAFSHDGRTVASAGDDRSIILWDASTGQRLGDALPGHDDSVAAVGFGAGDRSLVSGSDDRSVLVWNVDVSSWLDLACRVANRNLSSDEWSVFVGRGDQRPTCPSSG
ncbi:MAG: TIR domain-containing protein [Actinomycetota bacterium]|nr:TIR domain-containing protein [Actinomycetota bacterium]